MSRQTTSRVAWLMLALATFSGCSPTQPFYFHEDGDLSHYLDKATEIEYPDVHSEPLPDTSESLAPMTVSNPDFKEVWDLTLEGCVTIAMQNRDDPESRWGHAVRIRGCFGRANQRFNKRF
jgi:hypothetical protein